MIRSTSAQEALYHLHGFPEARNNRRPAMFEELKKLTAMLNEKVVAAEKPETLTTSRLVAEVAFCAMSMDVLDEQNKHLEGALTELEKAGENGEEAQTIRKVVTLLAEIPAMHKRCAAELDFRVPVPSSGVCR